MIDDRQPLTPHCYGHEGQHMLDWCDRLLAAEGADLDKREAKARAGGQMSLSLILAAQRAVVTRLRDRVRHHFWDEYKAHTHP